MEILREKTKEYIKKHGSTIQFFAKQLGISHTHMSLFLKGDRELSSTRENLLRCIVEKE